MGARPSRGCPPSPTATATAAICDAGADSAEAGGDDRAGDGMPGATASDGGATGVDATDGGLSQDVAAVDVTSDVASNDAPGFMRCDVVPGQLHDTRRRRRPELLRLQPSLLGQQSRGRRPPPSRPAPRSPGRRRSAPRTSAGAPFPSARAATSCATAGSTLARSPATSTLPATATACCPRIRPGTDLHVPTVTGVTARPLAAGAR